MLVVVSTLEKARFNDLATFGTVSRRGHITLSQLQQGRDGLVGSASERSEVQDLPLTQKKENTLITITYPKFLG